MEQGTEQSLPGIMNIGENDRQSRMEFVKFTDMDRQLLMEMRSMIQKNADKIMDGFYYIIQSYPELMEIIEKYGTSIDALKQTQKRYILEMFDGDYGQSYIERRLRIGIVHNKIGLTPRWYLGSYSIYGQLMIPLIMRKYWYRPIKRKQALLAFNKIISIDSQLAMDTYIHGLVSDLSDVSMSKDVIEETVADYSACVKNVSAGDLRERIVVRGDDDLSELGNNLNSMIDNLAGMTEKIRSASNGMQSMVVQMQSAIIAQTSGAAEQASAVNQTTTTLEEIKQTSAQTLDKSRALGGSAERTRLESEQGLDAVAEAINGMEAIRERVDDIAQTILALSEQSQQIGEITEVVNGLAQQSKMLALNASIEAAKAGEAGKGFAVVATEVKDLAEQSQQSTSQVQKILQNIRNATDRAVMATEEGSKGVDAGVLHAQRTNEIMKELGGVVRETEMATQQIVAAVRQETVGIDQVATAMSEINRVTNQFVTNTHQTQDACEGLTELVNELNKSVSVYKTE